MFPHSTPEPWGAHLPGRTTEALIRCCRAVPPLPLVRQLVFPLRRLARARLDAPVDHHLWGHRLRFRAKGNIAEGQLLFFPNRWDRREREVLAGVVRPGDLFVDVGANFGGYLWWLLSLLGDELRGVAIEPNPELHRRLLFNLATNGIEGVQVVPVAAGTETGRAELHLDPENRGASSLIREGARGERRTVEVRPLLRILEECRVERLDHLKLDIEGMEPGVLRAFFDDAPPELRPRTLLVEYRDTGPYRRMRDRLEALGYRVELATRMNLFLRQAPRPR